MDFTCEKYLLLNAVVTASRASAVRSSVIVMEGLLIQAGTNIKITGYDLKKGIYTRFQADIVEKGSVIINARLFSDIVRNLPDGIVRVTSDVNNNCHITCGSADFELIGLAAEDFPELPIIDNSDYISIPQNLIRKMISETIFAVSDNESRPVYNGSLFETDGNELTIVSVDGYRLALRREYIDTGNSKQLSFIVPGTTLTDLEKICSDVDDPVIINLGDKHISFTIGETVLISRRIEGEFLDYRKTVPTDFLISIIADRSELISIVDRVSLVIDDRTKNPIHLFLEDNRIRVYCMTPLGKAEDICLCEGETDELEIGFNNLYLRDALKAAQPGKLRILLNSSTSPCVIKPIEGEGFLYMLLPIRLRAD